MVNDLQIDTENLLDSPTYTKFICDLKIAGVRILEPRKSDISISHEDIQLSQFKSSDILNCLEQDGRRVIEYFFLKNKLLKSSQVEEFPINEELPNDEQANCVSSIGFGYSVLILHALEFLHLKNTPDTLNSWLKKRRIPKAKEYIKDISKYYSMVL